jgi:CRISPR-associated endonuclease/helicase Cas3
MRVVEASGESEDAPCELWGKLGADGSAWYPLEAHLADTAAASLGLWDLWLAPNLKHLFTELLGEQPREQFALIAAAHDIGKANPIFQTQTQTGSRPVGGQARERLERHADDLRSSGYPTPSILKVDQLDSSGGGRHEVFSQFVSVEAGLPEWVGFALGGHHGRYHRVLQMSGGVTPGAAHRSVCAGNWLRDSREILENLRSALGVSSEIPAIPERMVPSIVAVTGAIALADWLASDESSIEHGRATWTSTPDLQQYVQLRSGWFAERLPRMIGTHQTPAGSMRETFGFESPNGTQQAVASTGDSEFMVVMSPMGEGKTEAALMRHQVLGRALFFGLPTMATADAMFDRIRRFYRGAPAQAAVLAHSRAVLNSFYSSSDTEPIRSLGSDDPGSLSPGDWFRGRHRSLLAPVTVGTCDQALAASLPHKWVAMRLLGLANKHVILDEVHSYDAYQDELLCTLLTWLGLCAAPVTLLSATLPEVRVRRYLSEWSRGRTRFSGRPLPEIRLVYPGVLAASGAGPFFASQQIDAVVMPVDGVRGRAIDVSVIRFSSTVPKAAAESIAEFVKSQWSDGRSVAAIVNTVNLCVDVGRRLLEAHVPVKVLHSRMTASQRKRIEEDLQRSNGRNGPGGSVVVATQIIESSLDVDFDVIATQLSPAASLLQRTGRLWRHSHQGDDGDWIHPTQRSEHRPAAPEMVIFVDESGPTFRNSLPYTVAELRRTSAELLTRRQWRIPGDLQTFVDASTIQFSDLAREISDEELAHLTEEARKSLQAEQRQINWKALADEFAALPNVTSHDSIDESRQTRLQDLPSATIVALGTHGYRRQLPDSKCSLASSQDLLEHTVPVTGVLVATLAGHPNSVDLTDRHPLLRGVRALDIDALEDFELHPVLGLVPTQETT